MLVPSSVRDDELTESQRCEFGRWLQANADHDSVEPALKLTLVVSGDKPAVFISSEEWDEHFFELIDWLDLTVHQMNQMPGWFVAPVHGRLDLLPSNGLHEPKNAAWHRRLGVVLGYPTDAIEYFINRDSQTGAHERVENDDFSPDEIAFADFVFYRHDDSINGYEQAIADGKAIRARFFELAHMWDVPVIESLAEAFYQRSVEIYRGERTGRVYQSTEFEIKALGN